jgi:hypothetical protein|tara:strand:- start:143 stop:874 length:732 start_codon:yes stop_codon:yes gene_type:complete
MAYNFLGLVNAMNRRLNEVELTSSNFATATGFYSQAKDAVNAAIRYINQSEYFWSFNHTTKEQTLVANTSRYAFPTDAKVINFNTFRIKENTTLGNSTTRLTEIVYEDYLDRFVDQEYNSSTGQGVPRHVAQAPDLKFIMTPEPDKAYELVFEYYTFPTDLSATTDAPTIPERFQHVIVDGAMHYGYLFRGNTQDAMVMKEKFDEGIKYMRSQLINRTPYVRSYMLTGNTGGVSTGFSSVFNI